MLYGVDGSALTARTEQTVPPEYLRMVMVLADSSEQIQLGLHCARCKQDVRGANSTSDGLLRMECACRTFIGKNPMRAA